MLQEYKDIITIEEDVETLSNMTIEQIKSKLQSMNVEVSNKHHPKSFYINLYKEAFNIAEKRNLIKTRSSQDIIPEEKFINIKRERSESIKKSDREITKIEEDILNTEFKTTKGKISVKTFLLGSLTKSNASKINENYEETINLNVNVNVNGIDNTAFYDNSNMKAINDNQSVRRSSSIEIFTPKQSSEKKVITSKSKINNAEVPLQSETKIEPTMNSRINQKLDLNLNLNNSVNSKINNLNRSNSVISNRSATPYPLLKTSNSSLKNNIFFKKEFSIASNKNLPLEKLSRSHVIESINRTSLDLKYSSQFNSDSSNSNDIITQNELFRNIQSKFQNLFKILNKNKTQILKNVVLVITLSAVSYYLFNYLKFKLPNLNFAEFPFIDSKTLTIVSLLTVLVVVISFLIDKIRNSLERESILIASNSVEEMKKFLINNQEKFLIEEDFIIEYCKVNKHDQIEFRLNILPHIKEFIKSDEEIEETHINIDGSVRTVWRNKNLGN